MKTFTLDPDKWYIVDAKTDEPLKPPFASMEKAQEAADKVSFGKQVAIKQGKNVNWKLGEGDMNEAKMDGEWSGRAASGSTKFKDLDDWKAAAKKIGAKVNIISSGHEAIKGDKCVGHCDEKGGWLKEDLNEAHELITPMMVGTPDERLEALTLWADIVTKLKKISELPSAENRTALLRAVQSEAQCTLNRVMNVVVLPSTTTPHAEEVVDVDHPISEELTKALVTGFTDPKKLAKYVFDNVKDQNEAHAWFMRQGTTEPAGKERAPAHHNFIMLLAAKQHLENMYARKAGRKIPYPDVEKERFEDVQVEESQEFGCNVTAERLAEIAGITNRKL